MVEKKPAPPTLFEVSEELLEVMGDVDDLVAYATGDQVFPKLTPRPQKQLEKRARGTQKRLSDVIEMFYHACELKD